MTQEGFFSKADHLNLGLIYRKCCVFHTSSVTDWNVTFAVPMSWSHVVLCKTITGAMDYFQSNPFKSKEKSLLYFLFCLSLYLSSSHCHCVFCCPDDPGAELFFWHVSDEQVRILSVHTSMAQIKSPSFLHPGSSCLEKTHTCQKNASLVQKSRFTHTNQ